jgi:hypothetical protein
MTSCSSADVVACYAVASFQLTPLYHEVQCRHCMTYTMAAVPQAPQHFSTAVSCCMATAVVSLLLQ